MVHEFIRIFAAVACVLPVFSAPSEPLFKRSWSDTVQALAARNQSWLGRRTSPADELSSRSSWQFDIGCIGDGPGQSATYTDIYDAVNNWFWGSNTGSVCASNQEYKLGCAPSGQTPTLCTYDGSYSVWNNGIMDCYAYVALQSAVLQYCASAGHPDCGCGVYYDYGSGKCLVGSYTYHVSGTGTTGGNGPLEPVNVTTTVNKRDSLGPYYTDLAICSHNGAGDVTGWCEGSATHVC